MELLSIRPVLQPFLQKWSWLDGLASKPTTAKPPTPRGSHILRERRELQSLESQVLGDVVRALKNATDVPDEFVLKAAKYNIYFGDNFEKGYHPGDKYPADVKAWAEKIALYKTLKQELENVTEQLDEVEKKYESWLKGNKEEVSESVVLQKKTS